MTKPMTPPSADTIIVVKVLSTSFTEKRERGNYEGQSAGKADTKRNNII